MVCFIQIWDIAKGKCTHTIYSIASLARIRWRPQRKYHIASCSLLVDCSINIWDIRRPYVPFASFDHHKDVTTSKLWWTLEIWSVPTICLRNNWSTVVFRKLTAVGSFYVLELTNFRLQNGRLLSIASFWKFYLIQIWQASHSNDEHYRIIFWHALMWVYVDDVW